MAKGFLPYEVDQRLLLPPDLREWLPEGHLALFVLDVVQTLDLSAILDVHLQKDIRGREGYDPRMMVGLLTYAYCVGMPSSRKIEKATYEDVAFRVLTGNQQPDHTSIALFRKEHLAALAALFMQVLRLCQRAGLVKLGHVALDGTKVQANASKHKAMSYARMGETEKKLQDEVNRLLAEAERADAAEDAQYGKGQRGNELPAELARRESRLKKIREAKAALEAEARVEAEAKAREVEEKLAARARQEAETGKKMGGWSPLVPEPAQARPKDKAQRNFTDPDSRIMVDGATKAFTQAFNVEIAVDGEAQIIVAGDVTQQANDKRQLLPMAGLVRENVGRLPDNLSADSGFFSEEAVTDPRLADTNLLIPPDRQKHGGDSSVEGAVPPADAPTGTASAAEQMRDKLRNEAGRQLYKQRKAIVEPVFGQIKEARGFRRFLLRGLQNVRLEFDLIALTHNLLELFRSGWSPWTAAAAAPASLS